mgnify:CR=1 FL=1
MYCIIVALVLCLSQKYSKLAFSSSLSELLVLVVLFYLCYCVASCVALLLFMCVAPAQPLISISSNDDIEALLLLTQYCVCAI